MDQTTPSDTFPNGNQPQGDETQNAASKRKSEDASDTARESPTQVKKCRIKWTITNEGRDEYDPGWLYSDDSSDDDDNIEKSYCRLSVVKTKKNLFCIKACVNVQSDQTSTSAPGPSNSPGPSSAPDYYSIPGPSNALDFFSAPGPSNAASYYGGPGPSRALGSSGQSEGTATGAWIEISDDDSDDSEHSYDTATAASFEFTDDEWDNSSISDASEDSYGFPMSSESDDSNSGSAWSTTSGELYGNLLLVNMINEE